MAGPPAMGFRLSWMSDNRNIQLNGRNILLTLLFLVGFAIMAYPFVSNWWYQSRADSQMEAYTQSVSEDDAAAYKKAFKQVRAYNKQLVGQVVPDVFAIREGTTDAEYESMLNLLGDQMMGSVEIPAINVKLPVYHYSTEETLLKGAGHIFGSSLPVGGKSTHAVITAHRGLPAAAMFSDLDQVRKGDEFYLHILNKTLAYEVDRIEVVEPSETRSLAIEKGQDYVTLVTCTPYGVNTERLLVRGHRVDYNPDQAVASDFRPLGLMTKLGAALAGIVAAALVIWIYSRMRRRRGRHVVRSAAPAHAAKLKDGAPPSDGEEPSEEEPPEEEPPEEEPSEEEPSNEKRGSHAAKTRSDE